MACFKAKCRTVKYHFMFLNSKDCIRWGLLPPATQAMRQQSKLAKGRFTGDPSYEYEHVTTKKVGEGEEATEEEETVSSHSVCVCVCAYVHVCVVYK